MRFAHPCETLPARIVPSLSLYFGKCHPWNSYPLPNRLRIPKVAPLLLLATLGCGALVPDPFLWLVQVVLLGLVRKRLVRLRCPARGAGQLEVSRKASPCWRVVLTRTAVSFLWRDGRVGLPALLRQRCCLPLRAGSFDGSQLVYLSLPELSTKGEKRQR